MWNKGNFSNQHCSNKEKTIKSSKIFASVHNLSKKMEDSRKDSPFQTSKKKFLSKCDKRTWVAMILTQLIRSDLRMCQSQVFSIRRSITFIGLIKICSIKSSILRLNKTEQVFCHPPPLLLPLTLGFASGCVKGAVMHEVALSLLIHYMFSSLVRMELELMAWTIQEISPAHLPPFIKV